jgi:predicted transcriptional regulator
MNKEQKRIIEMITNQIYMKLREKRLTKKEFSKRINISANSITRVLKGKDFKVSTLISMCIELEINNLNLW